MRNLQSRCAHRAKTAAGQPIGQSPIWELTMTTEAIAKRIIDVLQSGPASKIDISVGAIRISPTTLSPVIPAIRRWIAGGKGIGVEVDGKLPPTAAAQYKFDRDVYAVPNDDYGKTVAERMYLYHESVHAMRDIQGDTEQGRKASTFLEDEAAAYVAGCLFFLYENGRTPAEVAPNAYPDYKIASLIARLVGNSKGPAIVSPTHAGMLVTILRYTPLYYDAGVEFYTPASVDGVKN